MEQTKSSLLLQEEARQKEEMEATKRFLKTAGIDVEQPTEPIQPNAEQAAKESKEMIGMFQEVNGGENNPDAYYHNEQS